MTLYPEVQKKAQDEIGNVIGHGRLPDFDDRDELPYVGAIVSELFRWLPVVPNGLFTLLSHLHHLTAAHIAPRTGVPHRLMEDDNYNGYYLPKGSICFPNLWCVTMIITYTCFGFISRYRGMLHDPETYSNPREFIPERFLGVSGNKPELNPRVIAFGFGRR